MKTMRTLSLERYGPTEDEEIPDHLYTLDDKQLLYANMIPPGYHYFFFAREQSQIFLSPKFEVVRFKKTNVYLNRIHIKPRVEEMNYNVY